MRARISQRFAQEEEGEVYSVTLKGKKNLQWLEEVCGRGVMWRGFFWRMLGMRLVVCFGAS